MRLAEVGQQVGVDEIGLQRGTEAAMPASEADVVVDARVVDRAVDVAVLGGDAGHGGAAGGLVLQLQLDVGAGLRAPCCRGQRLMAMAPSCTNWRQMAAPMPEPPPVTRMTRPCDPGPW